MQAAWIDPSGHLSLKAISCPHVDAENCLVSMEYCGICRTDLELSRGYMNFSGVPGHEWVGQSPHEVRVTSNINFGCGTCLLCQGGDDRHCSNRTVLGISGRVGTMAEYVVTPKRRLITIPAYIPSIQAVFLEPLAAALEIQQQITLSPKQEILLIGTGKLGQLIADVLLRQGFPLYYLGHQANKNLIVNRKGGLSLKLEGKRFSVIIEASGSQTGMKEALQRILPEGKIVVKSTFNGLTSLPLSQLVVDEIELLGSRCGRIETALSFWAQFRPDYCELISEVFPLHDVDKAFARAQDKDVIKVVLKNR